MQNFYQVKPYEEIKKINRKNRTEVERICDTEFIPNELLESLIQARSGKQQ